MLGHWLSLRLVPSSTLELLPEIMKVRGETAPGWR